MEEEKRIPDNRQNNPIEKNTRLSKEQDLQESIGRLLGELKTDSTEKEETFEEYCQRLGVDLNEFQSQRANVNSRMVEARWREVEDSMGVELTVAEIDEKTLEWISSQHFAKRIKEVFQNRFERGFAGKPDLVRAFINGREILYPGSRQLYASGDTPQTYYLTQIQEFTSMLSNPKAEKVFWDTLNNYVERTTFPTRGKEVEAYIDRKFGDSPISVWDVGCSKGEVTERMARNLPNTQVVGIDLEFPESEIYQFEMHKDTENVRYQKGDAFDLQDIQGNPDVIISLNTLRHFNMNGKGRAMYNFANKVNDGGVIILGPFKENVERDNSPVGMKVFSKRDGKFEKIDFIRDPSLEI